MSKPTYTVRDFRLPKVLGLAVHNARTAATAAAFAASVLPHIRKAQSEGAASLRQIADALNVMGVTTATGGRWYAQQVSNVLRRA